MPDDLTPEEDQVRRLLADARHDEAMPADVAARLDNVLIGLGEEREADGVVRPLRPTADDLAAAQRRRNVRSWLVAAAAVVVVGVGINQVDWSGLGGSADGDSASAGSDALEAPEAASDAGGARATARWQRAQLQLSVERFGEQVRDFRAAPEFEPKLDRDATEEDRNATLAQDRSTAGYSAVCDVGDIGPGRLVPVRYDGERAWLVFRHAEGDAQVVDLFLCGADEPTRSITLSAGRG